MDRDAPARASARQAVEIDDLGLTLVFSDGEEIRTEVSAKFRREKVAAELAAAGFDLAGWMTDPAGDFALSLAFRL